MVARTGLLVFWFGFLDDPAPTWVPRPTKYMAFRQKTCDFGKSPLSPLKSQNEAPRPPKTTQKSPKASQREPKGHPKTAPKPHKSPQRPPNTSPNDSKIDQKSHKKPNESSMRFSSKILSPNCSNMLNCCFLFACFRR